MPKNFNTIPGNTPVGDGETIRVKSDGSGWESYEYATQDSVDGKVSKSGDTMSGKLTILDSTPVNNFLMQRSASNSKTGATGTGYDATYAHFGGLEWNDSGTYGIGFGFKNSVDIASPVWIGAVTNNTFGNTTAHFCIGTRPTTETAPPTINLTVSTTGQLLANTAYSPIAGNALATKKYVDDAVAPSAIEPYRIINSSQTVKVEAENEGILITQDAHVISVVNDGDAMGFSMGTIGDTQSALLLKAGDDSNDGNISMVMTDAFGADYKISFTPTGTNFGAQHISSSLPPGSDNHLANKKYVDDGLSLKVNTSSLATVATTGAYADLTDKPTIPAAQVNSDWNSVSGVSQILNKPTIPKFISLSGTTTGGNVTFNVSPASFTALTRGGCNFKVDDSDKIYGYEITSFSNTSVTVNVKEQVFTGVTVLSITVLGSVSMNNVANGTTVYASFVGV